MVTWTGWQRSGKTKGHYDEGDFAGVIIAGPKQAFLEKGREYKLAGRKIDVKVSGGENLKYFTDGEN